MHDSTEVFLLLSATIAAIELLLYDFESCNFSVLWPLKAAVRLEFLESFTLEVLLSMVCAGLSVCFLSMITIF